MPNVERTAVVEAEQRADLVVQRLTSWSRAKVRGLFDHGCVSVDGRPIAEAGTPVAAGARVVVRYDPKRGYPEKPKRVRTSRAFALVHEDDHLIVVEKRAGWLTVPTEREKDGTLLDEVRAWVGGIAAKRLPFVGVVHRLDRGTSGLLVFSKTKAAYDGLKTQFEAKKPEREYVAIVAGDVREAHGTIESFLVTDPRNLDQYSTAAPGEGKRAVTRFSVVERLRGATVVSVRLETGRRNQIRVHFAEKGHPVLGDDRYERERAAHPNWRVDRLALHAKVLGFVHPITGERMRFEAPPPEPFAAFVAATRMRNAATTSRRGGDEAAAPRRASGDEPAPTGGRRHDGGAATTARRGGDRPTRTRRR